MKAFASWKLSITLVFAIAGCCMLHAADMTTASPAPTTTAVAAPAAAASPVAPPTPAAAPQATDSPMPAYQSLRQNELWPDGQSGDFFSPLKHIDLNPSGSVWVSIGGQVRERVESWGNFNLDTPSSAIHSDTFGLTRVMLHTDFHFGKYVRIFAESKSALSTNRDLTGGLRTSDVDVIDVQALFTEFYVPVNERVSFTPRIGRQDMEFGKSRLVSAGNWSNSRKTFDGVTGALSFYGWSLTGGWVHPVVISKYAIDQADTHTNFFIAYATGKVPHTKVNADAYWFEYDRPTASYNGKTGVEQRYTTGGRLFG